MEVLGQHERGCRHDRQLIAIVDRNHRARSVSINTVIDNQGMEDRTSSL